ncbi:MAG: hypothetical protein EOO52_13490 [Gammaproteobacteria bacterium]|nr:MAG: hypothetical protein EOO52_13490 [Gammaproteobacteria bacterium]
MNSGNDITNITTDAKADGKSTAIKFLKDNLSFRKLLPSLCSISLAMENFLDTLIHASAESINFSGENNEFVVITMPLLLQTSKSLGRGESISLMRRRLTELEKLGLLKIYKHYGSSNSARYAVYEVKDLTPLINMAHVRDRATEKVKKSRHSKQSITLTKDIFGCDESTIMLTGHHEVQVFWHNKLFNGILDLASRLSAKDTRTVIDVECMINNEHLSIRALCSSDATSSISMLSDQRVMRPLNGYCLKDIRRTMKKLERQYGKNFDRRLVPNRFCIDIHELCSLMGLKPSKSAIEAVVVKMRRLADTTYHVDASRSPWFQRTFSSIAFENRVFSDTYEFRYINSLEIAREQGRIADLFGQAIESFTPRFYTFSLEPHLFESLMSDRSTLFISHPGLATEQGGLVQRIYNWSKSLIGNTRKSNLEDKWFSIHDMYLNLTPAARYDNFRFHFFNALQKFACGDSEFKKGVAGKSLIYGYFYHYQHIDGQDYFRVERDVNDPLVGDMSPANKHRARNLTIDLYGDRLELPAIDEFSLTE